MYLTEKKIVVLIGVCGFLWFPADAHAEEPLLVTTSPPQDISLPLWETPTGDFLLEKGLTTEPVLEEETVFGDSFHLPSGNRISGRVMQTRFFLGEKIGQQVINPETSFRMSAKGSFRSYLNEREVVFPIDRKPFWSRGSL